MQQCVAALWVIQGLFGLLLAAVAMVGLTIRDVLEANRT